MNVIPDRTEEVKKLQNRIDELSIDLSNFTESNKMMNKILGIYRHPKDKGGIGYNEKKTFFKQKKKNIHSWNKAKYRPHKENYTNPKGPKKIWVPKKDIIYVADILNRKRYTPPMVPGQWMLATHDGKKVYVPRPPT